jgi:GT2 family glycosyltransferase
MGEETPRPLVSLVVPTLNREAVLCDTLAALLEQAYDPWELIVVDQTAQHEAATETFLRELARNDQIRYYRFDRASLPRARNFGLRQASGEIVIFVDDDVVPSPGLIAAHADAYEDATVGGVAGRRTFPAHASRDEPPAPVGIMLRTSDPVTHFSSTQATEVELAQGCNMSFRRSLLERIGGFEPRYLGTAVYEEADVCFRIRALGYRILFVPEAHVVHLAASHGGCVSRREDRRNHYSLIHNSLLFTWRNRRRWDLVLATLWSRFLMLGALIKQGRPLAEVLSLLPAFPHAVWSYVRSRKRSALAKEGVVCALG